MASLLENLVETLDRETTEDEDLVDLSRKKTPVIVKGDIKNLEKITEDEQEVVGRIIHLEKLRVEVLTDIADVMNRDVHTLKLKNLVQMLEKTPEQQKLLMEVQEKLKKTVEGLKEVNERNQMLLKDAMEMVHFDLSMIQALKAAPQTANYTKKAYNSGSILGVVHGGFDAKQ